MHTNDTIRIGLLHSQSGPWAEDEAPLLDAALLAVDEINALGGVLHCRLECIVADTASCAQGYAERAEELIVEKNVSALFGGCNSQSRKAVKPVVEKYGALFWYPLPCEGLEESPNIFYTGTCLNQQIMPAIDWCWERGWRTYYLAGTDYIYPVAANKLIASVLLHKNGRVAGEKYYPPGHTDFSELIEELGEKRPDAIINTISGPDNVCFFEQLGKNGFDAAVLPVMSAFISERESLGIGNFLTGHYACQPYFRFLDNSLNVAFVRKFNRRHGNDDAICASTVMAYAQIFMWKQCAEFARSHEPQMVRRFAAGQTFDTPAGRMTMMSNQYVTRRSYIGRAVQPGVFETVNGNGVMVEPLPWQGIENLDFPAGFFVREILGNFPETLNFNAQLEERVASRTEDLRKSEEWLRIIVERMPVMMAAFDEAGAILAWNDECERVTGFSINELTGNPRPFDALFSDATTGAGFMSDVTDQQHDFRDREYLLTCRDGTAKTILWSKVSSKYPIVGWHSWVIGTDVTEHRKTRDELQKRQRLESLGTLAGGIAHDFNNLLGAIFGNIDLAKASLDDMESVSRYLESAETALGKARDLTRRLLTFSRSESGTFEMISLLTVIEEACAIALSGSNVKYEIEAAPDLHAIEANTYQLGQAFANLLINARQAMPSGGKITITARNETVSRGLIAEIPEGEYTVVTVTDQGSGIPEEVLPRIFEPFFTTGDNCTGLGLAMCHSIIHRHRGAITVESGKGRATTFSVFLPAAVPAIPELSQNDAARDESGGSILVMDDDPMTLDVAKNILELLGYEVTCATEGAAAISALRARIEEGLTFDAALLDLTIQGGIGGKQVMERLRKLDPTIPGIVSSGYTYSPILQEPEKFGFAGKIEKPYRKEELRRVLQRVLGRTATA